MRWMGWLARACKRSRLGQVHAALEPARVWISSTMTV